MPEKQPMPAAGIFLGRRFDPEMHFDSERADGTVNDDPMTASDALRETLEGQGQVPPKL